MTPDQLRDHMTALALGARRLALQLHMGRNGERSIRRMLTGQTRISAAFEKKVLDARKGVWPAGHNPVQPAASPEPAKPDDPRNVMDALAGRR